MTESFCGFTGKKLANRSDPPDRPSKYAYSVNLLLHFETNVNHDTGHLGAGTAQWLERRIRDREVAGSNPCRSGGSSNWILMSCQPHRVTSGQSNSGHKQIHISKLFLHLYQPSLKSIYKTNHFANIKHTYTNIRFSPFNITPVKRAHKARTCWYCRPFRLIYRYNDKEKYKKGMDTI